MSVKVRSVNDLLRFIYFSYKKLGYNRPVIFLYKYKNQCITFIHNRDRRFLLGNLMFLYSIGQCKGQLYGYLYKFSRGEKAIPVEEISGILRDEKKFIPIINVKIQVKDFALKMLDGKNNQTFEKILERGNKIKNFLEFARISTYYQEPVFVYGLEENWYYLMDLSFILKDLKAGRENFSLIYALGPEPRKAGKLASFLKYVEGSESISSHYAFSRALKPLEYFSPIIHVKAFKNNEGFSP